jgi:hypothetical protein
VQPPSLRWRARPAGGPGNYGSAGNVESVLTDSTGAERVRIPPSPPLSTIDFSSVSALLSERRNLSAIQNPFTWAGPQSGLLESALRLRVTFPRDIRSESTEPSDFTQNCVGALSQRCGVDRGLLALLDATVQEPHNLLAGPNIPEDSVKGCECGFV